MSSWTVFVTAGPRPGLSDRPRQTTADRRQTMDIGQTTAGPRPGLSDRPGADHGRPEADNGQTTAGPRPRGLSDRPGADQSRPGQTRTDHCRTAAQRSLRTLSGVTDRGTDRGQASQTSRTDQGQVGSRPGQTAGRPGQTTPPPDSHPIRPSASESCPYAGLVSPCTHHRHSVGRSRSPTGGIHSPPTRRSPVTWCKMSHHCRHLHHHHPLPGGAGGWAEDTRGAHTAPSSS